MTRLHLSPLRMTLATWCTESCSIPTNGRTRTSKLSVRLDPWKNSWKSSPKVGSARFLWLCLCIEIPWLTPGPWGSNWEENTIRPFALVEVLGGGSGGAGECSVAVCLWRTYWGSLFRSRAFVHRYSTETEETSSDCPGERRNQRGTNFVDLILCREFWSELEIRACLMSSTLHII